jgi:hypothetical protein
MGAYVLWTTIALLPCTTEDVLPSDGGRDGRKKHFIHFDLDQRSPVLALIITRISVLLSC